MDVSKHHAWVSYGSPATPADFDVVSSTALEVRQYTYAQFTIDDSRALLAAATRRPSGTADTLVLGVRLETITAEAQHALLKVLEEPPPSTCFLFSLPDEQQLLPTVRSRLQKTSQSAVTSVAAEPELLTGAVADALKLLERKLKQSDSEWLQGERARLLQWVQGERAQALAPRTRAALVRAITRVGTRGAVNKWLLESVIVTAHPALRSQSVV